MVRTSPRHRRIVERTRARRSHCRRHVIGDFAWLRRLANVEYPDSRFEITVVLRKNSNPLELSWWRDYWPAVASSQRDRSASYRPSVADRPGRADRAFGQTPASHRSRAFGPASSAGALQGAGHETPAHRCRDARKLGLAVAVLRLALLPGDRPSGKRAALATEPAGDYSGAASRDRGVRRFLSTCGDSYGAWPGRIRYGARKELQTSCC